ncbi:MAG: UDP-N-acetylmuramoyl-L-alanine--D-glutamate ligase [Burkholderiaceae bacterium]
MVRHASACGAQLRIADTRAMPPGLATLRERHPGLEPVTGEFTAALLDDIDALCVSPGVSIEIGTAAELVASARRAGMPVWGELDLFLAAVCSAEGEAPKLVGVTGTNGKTTVTALTTLLLGAAGLNARAAGNIGPAMLDAWHDALAADDLPQAWVLELSSFQLAIAQPPALDVAAILNISQDHLDWHVSLESYAAAKARIASASSVLVCRREEPATQLADASRSILIGLDEPRRIGDLGVLNEGGIAWLAEALADEDGVPRKRGDPPAGMRLNRLMPAEALHLRGAHNQLNALAALAIARRLGLPMADLLHGLRDYRGEPHRCQLLATLDGVDYVDDSKGTNVGATVAALSGLGKRCWLIAGGVGKGQDFTPLIEPVRAHAAGVLLIGESAPALSKLLHGAAARIHCCADLPDAVRVAAESASAGEAVLLSPACASFDMFRNYRERGQVFAGCVQEIASQRGIVTELPC